MIRHLASAQWDWPACVFIMDIYKATLSVVRWASLHLPELAIVHWIGAKNQGFK